MLEPAQLYFAYGSNMSGALLRRRCPSARALGPALLPGHRLVFFLDDPLWEGGVAGVVPDPAEQVEGVLWELAPADLPPLDRYEDVAGGDYRRERRTVLARGAPREVWLYLPAREVDRPRAPSRAYLEALLAGAREHGLSAAWQAGLRAALPPAAAGG